MFVDIHTWVDHLMSQVLCSCLLHFELSILGLLRAREFLGLSFPRNVDRLTLTHFKQSKFKFSKI